MANRRIVSQCVPRPDALHSAAHKSMPGECGLRVGILHLHSGTPPPPPQIRLPPTGSFHKSHHSSSNITLSNSPSAHCCCHRCCVNQQNAIRDNHAKVCHPSRYNCLL